MNMSGTCETISKAMNTYNFNPSITRLGNNSICINKCGKLRFHERCKYPIQEAQQI